jgi:nucleotide-binding universal stress UspA family protein
MLHQHFKKILVATDGSEGARRAFKVAVDLAAKYGSKLELISVLEGSPKFATSISEAKMMEERQREHFEDIHHTPLVEAAKAGVDLSSKILPGHEVMTLVEYAKKQKHDLLVVGIHGHSTQGTGRTGATARAIVEESPCAVLLA